MSRSRRKGRPRRKGCCPPARPASSRVSPEPHPRTRQGAPAEDEVISIPGGRGFIGTDSPFLAIDEEAPFRAVELNPFRMDATAVTNERFAAFVEATGYRTEAEKFGDSFVFMGFLKDQRDTGNAVAAATWWRMVKGACWHRPAGPDSDLAALPDHPVVHVSWNDACAFAKWAGGRLPTEAEWEHAARGGRADVAYPWGDRAPDDTEFFPCNIWQGPFPEQNTEGDGFFGTAPVRSFQPNGYGLFNMVGNAWEWTSQEFEVRSDDPRLRQVHQGREGFKVCKGGSYLCHASYCHRYRIAARTANSPDSSTGHAGFRLVYDQPPDTG